MSLSAKQGVELYFKAVEKNTERQAWERWLIDYQNMTTETFKSFSEYLKEIKQPRYRTDNRTDKEIINDAESILKSMKRSV